MKMEAEIEMMHLHAKECQDYDQKVGQRHGIDDTSEKKQPGQHFDFRFLASGTVNQPLSAISSHPIYGSF